MKLFLVLLFALFMCWLVRKLYEAEQRDKARNAMLEGLCQWRGFASDKLMRIEGTLTELANRPTPSLYIPDKEPSIVRPKSNERPRVNGRFVKAE